jgi:PEP-CTERM/exosortase A-associated glycosyltransferase
VKVLHVLESSVPDTGGYTIRARYIVDFQRRLGISPVVITSPLFPRVPSGPIDEIDGVRYYRTNNIASPAKAKSKLAAYAIRATMLARYRHAVMDVVRRERPDVIHAHSSYTNPRSALPAARRRGLPLIYEVRTLWGESAVIEDGLRPDSWKHRLVWRFELDAMRRADLVVPIAQGIRDELIRRGIPASKLEVVPNGVDTSKFTPGPRDEARARSAGLTGQFVIGFIGTIRRLEGLATLIDGFQILQRDRPNVRLVIVGDGSERSEVQARAKRLGLDGVLFTGTVPHADVASWYSVMDVLVYPRIRAVINERVTPLKPLEAMALGRVCVGSDVGGLTELIRDEQTGLIFRADDPAHLAARLQLLIDDPARMDRLRQSALRTVRQERDWGSIVPRYSELYERLIRQTRRHGGGSGSWPAPSADPRP